MARRERAGSLFWHTHSLSAQSEAAHYLHICALLTDAQYLDVITKAWGDWTLFQELLSTLRKVGDLHGGASIANIATRWVLDHPFVGAVLVGVRMGVSEHGEGAAAHCPTR